MLSVKLLKTQVGCAKVGKNNERNLFAGKQPIKAAMHGLQALLLFV